MDSDPRQAVKPCPRATTAHVGRELVVELVTAAMFVTMSIHFHDPVVTIAYLFFCAFLVAVSAIDLEHYRIPDRLVFPSLAIAVPVVVLVSFQQDIPEAIPGRSSARPRSSASSSSSI